MKTKTKKALALFTLSAVLAGNAGLALAKDIWDAKVVDDASKNVKITWDEQFPITATGTITGIKVKAVVEPQIDMSISNKEINLGTLVSTTKKEGTLKIEVGTNAANGVNLTVASTNAGLQNKQNTSVKINSDTASGIPGNYTFKSEAGTTDSTATGFTAQVLTETEIKDTTARSIYKTNKPEAFTEDAVNDVTFTVWAKINAQTPAGEYEDLLNFTITGNF